MRKQRAWLCLGALLAAVPVALLRAQTYDVVIVNGRVIDPNRTWMPFDPLVSMAGRLPLSPRND